MLSSRVSKKTINIIRKLWQSEMAKIYLLAKIALESVVVKFNIWLEMLWNQSRIRINNIVMAMGWQLW